MSVLKCTHLSDFWIEFLNLLVHLSDCIHCFIHIWLQFDDEEPELQYGGTASGRKRWFSKELRCMMFGFGDDLNPYTESVDLLEDLVMEYITDMVRNTSII